MTTVFGNQFPLLCAGALLVLVGACDEGTLTAPKLDPSAPSLDIDVTPGTMAFDVHMNGQPLAGFGADYCPFLMYIDRTEQNGWGQLVREVCTDATGAFAAVVPNLPTGTHTIELRFNSAPEGSDELRPVVASATVTLEASSQARAVFELKETMGIVQGQFTVDGQQIPAFKRYAVCSAIAGQLGPCAPAGAGAGAFRFFDLPGNRVAFIRSGQSRFWWINGAPIALVNYTVAANSTTTIDPMDLATSTLLVTPRFGSLTPAELGLSQDLCIHHFSLYIDRPETNPPWHFGPRVRHLCGTALGTAVALDDMPIGDHTFELRFDGPPATPGTVQGVIWSARVSLPRGGTAAVEFDLAETMGVVTGKVAIPAGASPNPYMICLASFGWVAGCFFPDADGSFGFFDHPGERGAVVLRSDGSAETVASFSYTVERGRRTDLGVVSDKAPLLLQFKFDGAPLDGLGASPGPGFGCSNRPFAVYAGDEETFVQEVCVDENGSLASVPIVSLAPGQQRLTIRYNGFLRGAQTLATVFSQVVTIEPGTTLTQVVELKDVMGLVTGRLRINGGVPPADQHFQICGRFVQSFSWPCTWVDAATGSFKFIDLPGARSAVVQAGGLEISSFAYSVVAGQTTIVGTTTGGVHGETPTGVDVEVTPIVQAEGVGEDERPVKLTFSNVETRGITTVSGGLPPPLEFDAVTIVYEIQTSAEYTGEIDVCINYPATTPREEDLRLFHGEPGPNGQTVWTDVTRLPVDVANNVICATVSTLSPFFAGYGTNVAPVAHLAAPTTADEGSTVRFDASGSSDRGGTIERYEWDLDGDGTFEVSGTTSDYAVRELTVADERTLTVTVRVTDNGGKPDTESATVRVGNVAPTISGMPGSVTLIDNETHTGTGSFTDPGADSWTATVSYGEGAASALALTNKTFELSHTYRTPGRFTISVSVSDGDGGTGAGTMLVVVQTHKEAVLDLMRALVTMLAPTLRQPLVEKLQAAIKQLEVGRYQPAINHVEAYMKLVSGLVRARRLTPAQGATLTAQAARVVRAMELELPKAEEDDDKSKDDR